jgi:phage tail-like protein
MDKRILLGVVSLFLCVMFLASSVSGPATTQNDEHFPNFNFKLEIDGFTPAYFSEVSGLGMEVEVTEYRDGSDNVVRKIPGRLKYTDITLKRGVVGTTDYFDWIKEIARGSVDYRDGSLTVINQRHEEVVTYHFYRAFPVKWSGPETEAAGKGGGEVAMEEMTLAVEDLVMEIR